MHVGRTKYVKKKLWWNITNDFMAKQQEYRVSVPLKLYVFQRTRTETDCLISFLGNWSNSDENQPICIINRVISLVIFSGLCVFQCLTEYCVHRQARAHTHTHSEGSVGKVLDVPAHIPPLLLPETWMIWLFDDSLFHKSVSAPYVSNTPLARSLNALPWALWEASAAP